MLGCRAPSRKLPAVAGRRPGSCSLPVICMCLSCATAPLLQDAKDVMHNLVIKSPRPACRPGWRGCPAHAWLPPASASAPPHCSPGSGQTPCAHPHQLQLNCSCRQEHCCSLSRKEQFANAVIEGCHWLCQCACPNLETAKGQQSATSHERLIGQGCLMILPRRA